MLKQVSSISRVLKDTCGAEFAHKRGKDEEINTGEHSTWNFENGSEKIRMGKGLDKDKVEGKKEKKKY